MSDSWNPDQYRRFADERAAPFHDLLGLIDPGPGARVVDLGCGTGELTAHAASLLGAASVEGIDNSSAMLASATVHAGERVRFEHGDIASWTAAGDVDVVIANASLQWVPDHRAVLERWAAALAPGGWLAVQVPANAHAATHTVATEVARREPFRSAFGEAGPPIDPVAANVLPPESYSRVLWELGLVDQQVMLRVYAHTLDSTRDAVEWVKGTMLTRFARVLPEPLYRQFVDAYEQALIEEVGDHRPFFFPFNRILFRARRPG